MTSITLGTAVVSAAANIFAVSTSFAVTGIDFNIQRVFPSREIDAADGTFIEFMKTVTAMTAIAQTALSEPLRSSDETRSDTSSLIISEFRTTITAHIIAKMPPIKLFMT